MHRIDGRTATELRTIRFTPSVAEYAEGSCLVEFGKTKILVTASYEAQAPKWLQGTGSGWITAEYGMLPRATEQRVKREKTISSGRTQEIARLIGRTLRAAVNLKKFPEKQIYLDCDVLHADGGTRTASICGAFVAMALAFKKLHAVGEIREIPLIQYVAAVSIGLQGKEVLTDLNYDEDSRIGTDMNFAMTEMNEFIEIQGTAEKEPFSKAQLLQMLESAETACRSIFELQAQIVGDVFPLRSSGAP